MIRMYHACQISLLRRVCCVWGLVILPGKRGKSTLYNKQRSNYRYPIKMVPYQFCLKLSKCLTFFLRRINLTVFPVFGHEIWLYILYLCTKYGFIYILYLGNKNPVFILYFKNHQLTPLPEVFVGVRRCTWLSASGCPMCP